MKKISFLLIIVLVTWSCNEDPKLKFETQHIEKSSDAQININYPKAIGPKAVSEKINQHIEHVIANEMNMADTAEHKMALSEAVSQFDQEYKDFKKQFQDSAQKWEVKVEGEVIYEALEVICVSLQSYTDTGGAHGNSRVSFLNFNPKTGDIIEQNDLISNRAEFTKIAEKAFKAQTEPKDGEETMEDYFFGEEFQLPSNIGFSTEGLVLLYNNYEIASYVQGITEVLLPYAQVKDLLKVNP